MRSIRLPTAPARIKTSAQRRKRRSFGSLHRKKRMTAAAIQVTMMTTICVASPVSSPGIFQLNEIPSL